MKKETRQIKQIEFSCTSVNICISLLIHQFTFLCWSNFQFHDFLSLSPLVTNCYQIFCLSNTKSAVKTCTICNLPPFDTGYTFKSTLLKTCTQFSSYYQILYCLMVTAIITILFRRYFLLRWEELKCLLFCFNWNFDFVGVM